MLFRSLLREICSYPNLLLGDFMAHSFQMVLAYLGISTKLILSSSIEKGNSLHGTAKIKHICHLLDADTYYNAIGGQALYDKDDFAAEGLVLHFLHTNQIEYKQFKNEFVPNLSFIDVLMFNSPEQVLGMLKEYTLV